MRSPRGVGAGAPAVRRNELPVLLDAAPRGVRGQSRRAHAVVRGCRDIGAARHYGSPPGGRVRGFQAIPARHRAADRALADPPALPSDDAGAAGTGRICRDVRADEPDASNVRPMTAAVERELVVLGAGGFGRETVEAVRAPKDGGPRRRLARVLDDDPARHRTAVRGVPLLAGTVELDKDATRSVLVRTGPPV